MSQPDVATPPASPDAKRSGHVGLWIVLAVIALLVGLLIIGSLADSKQRQDCAQENADTALSTPIGEDPVRQDCM